MSKPQGKCIFCDGPGLTKEHLWPKWMRPLLEDGAELGHSSFRTSVTNIPYMNARNIGTDGRALQGYAFNKRLRVVCKSCNGGWMSSIESEMKPILRGLFDSSVTILTEEMQTRIAFWMALRTAVFERDDLRWATLTQAENAYLREAKIPPTNWRIWICSREGNDWTTRVAHVGATLQAPWSLNREAPNAQKTLLGMKDLALLSASTSSDAVEKFLAAVTPPKMLQIWPFVQNLTWPTQQTLTDEEMFRIAYIPPHSI